MKPTIYQVFPRIELSDRQWPSTVPSSAPTWCSIDLRDGDQALPSPMTLEQKVTLFNLLVKIGIKQIEIGTPSTSETDRQLIAYLIEHKLIPNDVTLQVMSQIKTPAIDTTFEAIAGLKNVIVHLYNTTSFLRRDAIYDMEVEAIIEKAKEGFIYAKSLADKLNNTHVQFEYSPEGFNTTEPRLLVAICHAVNDVVSPSEDNPLILNLQSTVEVDLPNVFADQVEWLKRQLSKLEHIVLSIQPHNDRGTAVASAELGVLAGATRVEGALLGNGERAGSACLLTLALNLYTQGIEPKLTLDNVNHIANVVEQCTGLSTPERHPYAGKLAFAAFSAPHQFAINEAFQSYMSSDKSHWHVPYLPMDPTDIGRGYDDIIRLTAMSGRTGIAHVMEKYHGYFLPRTMQSEFSQVIKQRAMQNGSELTAQQVWDYFADEYFKGQAPLELKSVNFQKLDSDSDLLACEGEILFNEELHAISCQGKGALDTLSNALKDTFNLNFDVAEYVQHALGEGSTATAVSYIKLRDEQDTNYWGVGVDSDSTLATLRALICAANRKMESTND